MLRLSVASFALALALTVPLVAACEKTETPPPSSSAPAPSSSSSATTPGAASPDAGPSSAAAPPSPAAPSLAQPPPVKSAMWSMAQASNTLAEMFEKAGTPTTAELTQAKRLVDEMDQTAAALAADPAAAGHPLLGKGGLANFRADIQAARAALDRQPPDVQPARLLATSCRQCHAIAAAPTAWPAQRWAAR